MRRTRVVLIGLVILALVVAGTVIIVGVLQPPAEPAASIGSPAALSADEERFYRQVAPALGAAAAEARALTRQGQERSRNIFAIRAGQDRLEGHLRTLDVAFAAAIPARFAAVAERYQPAATAIRTAIRQAEAGFFRFDWDAVGAATELMAAGTAHLEAAVRELDAAAALPTAAPPATPSRSAGRLVRSVSPTRWRRFGPAWRS